MIYKLRDGLRSERLSRNDNKDFSLWLLLIMAVQEGKGMDSVAQDTEEEPLKEDGLHMSGTSEKSHGKGSYCHFPW